MSEVQKSRLIIINSVCDQIQKEKYGFYKYKPKVVLDYNLSMGEIDKKDQLLQAFPIERVRNHIWYKKLFRRLINVSIHNAFVTYQSAVLPGIKQRALRVQLVDEILQRFRQYRCRLTLIIGLREPDTL